MSALAYQHHSSYYAAAREQSIRRSLLAINRPPSYHTPTTTDDTNHGIREEDFTRSDRRESNKKVVVRNKSRSSSKKINRRGSLTSAVACHCQTSSSSSSSSDYYEQTPLPFSMDGTTQRHRESSQERLPTRESFQRSYSPFLTAAMAQEMVMQLALARLESSCEPRRRAIVAFDSLPQQQESNDTKSDVEKDQQEQHQHQHKGVRQDYLLGETTRSHSHMIIEPISGRSLQAINSLQKHDFAFVKRSDGSYSYAILAYRSSEPIKGRANKNSAIAEEECMIFVMNGIGNTKTIRQRYWSEFVRLPYIAPCQEIPDVVCQDIENNNNDNDLAPPPSMIFFIPQVEHNDDECSLISSVSDRARR